MRRLSTITLILVLLLSAIQSYAGDKKVGIRGGYQVGNLYINGDAMHGNFNTFYVGLFKEVKIIPLLKFGSGLDYYQNGTYKDSDNKINLHYLSVPLYLKVKIGPVFALAGAAANFKVGEKWTFAGNTFTSYKSKTFDLPVFGGVGVKFAFLTIEARYYYGTMTINDNSLSATNGAHNQFLQIGLGVSI